MKLQNFVVKVVLKEMNYSVVWNSVPEQSSNILYLPDSKFGQDYRLKTSLFSNVVSARMTSKLPGFKEAVLCNLGIESD